MFLLFYFIHNCSQSLQALLAVLWKHLKNQASVYCKNLCYCCLCYFVLSASFHQANKISRPDRPYAQKLISRLFLWKVISFFWLYGLLCVGWITEKVKKGLLRILLFCFIFQMCSKLHTYVLSCLVDLFASFGCRHTTKAFLIRIYRHYKHYMTHQAWLFLCISWDMILLVPLFV